MTTNHIDQLAEWWENAAPIDEAVDPGTVIIGCMADGSYEIFTECDRNAPEDYAGGHTDYRILARAPEPKPAWHDAVAVMAETKDDDIRRAFVPQYDTETGEERVDTWADWQGAYDAADLIDPTPLIEAKVTDEQVNRVDDLFRAFYGTSTLTAARELVAAAFGIEAE